jgi:hypothetical protein
MRLPYIGISTRRFVNNLAADHGHDALRGQDFGGGDFHYVTREW